MQGFVIEKHGDIVYVGRPENKLKTLSAIQMERWERSKKERRAYEPPAFDWTRLPNPPPGTSWRIGKESAVLVKHGDLLGPPLPLEQWPEIDKK